MKKASVLIFFAVIATASVLWAQGTSKTGPARTAADLIKAGDDLYAKFDDAGALAQYLKAAELESSNYEALWKTAQAYMNVGDHVDYRDKDHEKIMLRYFLAGDKYLKKALALNPNDSQTRFLNAAILGREARTASTSKQIALAYTIKGEIDLALKLNPKNDMAWHALAFWHRILAEVGGAKRFIGSIIFGRIPKGSFDEAVKGFEKAISFNPVYCNHHFELARTYLDLEKKDLAIKEFEAGLKCPDITSMCARFKARAKRELERLKAGEDAAESGAGD